ncbi:DUF547 domain-containing protein [Winogradskyella sp. DF17]|uniref:DUF547 domain-containing protein n=1 Tax=Winogradskyella pelagia TaxID=2819984 RepID=A0ABS3SYZ5_9FLAO|nr:DUF547 domain-containing protein [Winogradskyella sp. DF17]MBO3115702.1 DUF547 domain-containing protein [Winogradskyella sp. DF17]
MKFYLVLFTIFWSALIYAQPSHDIWNNLLKAHVSSNGNVDYQGIQNNTEDLENYISVLQNNMPTENWAKNEKLAYWINAYNALTIDLILRHYPINSIKELKKPWDQPLWHFGDKTMSLNDIEHKILRKMGEPRIHFAIVCASVSCPKLLNEAYTADAIEQQLSKATQEFLSDSSKNKISKDRLELSKIFKWFAKDFKANNSLRGFISLYSNVEIAPKAKISYLDYNWDLNE